jgi:hypothetical protein
VSHVCPECASRCRCYEGEADTETCVHDCEHDDEMADDVDELDFEEDHEILDTIDDEMRGEGA